jgi:hypothetical protein
MKTITINIPDNKTNEVLKLLKKFGVKISTSQLSNLDKLTKEDYEKHFLNRASVNKNKLFDETAYLLKSPANAERLLKSIQDYRKGLPS